MFSAPSILSSAVFTACIFFVSTQPIPQINSMSSPYGSPGVGYPSGEGMPNSLGQGFNSAGGSLGGGIGSLSGSAISYPSGSNPYLGGGGGYGSGLAGESGMSGMQNGRDSSRYNGNHGIGSSRDMGYGYGNGRNTAGNVGSFSSSSGDGMQNGSRRGSGMGYGNFDSGTASLETPSRYALISCMGVLGFLFL